MFVTMAAKSLSSWTRKSTVAGAAETKKVKKNFYKLVNFVQYTLGKHEREDVQGTVQRARLLSCSPGFESSVSPAHS
jgi:hypothetical protein